MDRRDLLRAVAALPLLRAALPDQALAQGYPARNITMIVPFPAGGQADLAARPVAMALERILGKPVIVDNRAGGGGGSVGNAAAARAESDGYTLLMTLSSLAVLPEADRLFDRPVAYEVSQFMPIARVLADPTLLAVPVSAPWKTAQDFIEDAKKRPGQITYGSSGPYGTLHVAMEMFANSAGIKLLHVPFRGAGPALTALLSGTVQAIAAAPGTLKPQVDDGKLRVLGNCGARRIASFPDVPTFQELGYKDVEMYIWAGLFAQSSLPAPIATRLREAMAQVMGESGGPQVLRGLRQSRRLSGRAGVLAFRRRRQCAADHGREEDRPGGVGSGPTFTFFCSSRTCPRLID
ncbi:tripartite-type tricarboxylate transporter receptor subunit TctC [Bradyrhizobium diazoefficiens]